MGGSLIALLLALAPQQAGGDVELLRELAAVPAAELQPWLVRGHERLVELARAGDPGVALPIAEALFARAPAAWSADSLSLTLSRLGEHDRARAVLGPILETTPVGPEREALLQRRALASLGAGDREAALVDLGAGLAEGSVDAAAVLGMLALREGRVQRARRLFRGILTVTPPGDPRQAWARRGWGLTMLP